MIPNFPTTIPQCNRPNYHFPLFTLFIYLLLISLVCIHVCCTHSQVHMLMLMTVFRGVHYLFPSCVFCGMAVSIFTAEPFSSPMAEIDECDSLFLISLERAYVDISTCHHLVFRQGEEHYPYGQKSAWVMNVRPWISLWDSASSRRSLSIGRTQTTNHHRKKQIKQMPVQF